MAEKGESVDQSERTVQAKSTPKDALVMGAILKEMGISEYEPRVINQMLEFTYRYITTVLEDAQVYRKHAGKKELDAEDVQLAIQTRLDHSYTSPPPREFLIEIARQKNRHPLPQIQTKSGLRLPPDRYCLTSTNYKVKAQKKHSQVRVNPLVTRTISQSSALSSTVTPIKTTPATIIAVKMPATVSPVTGTSPSITTPASTPVVVAGTVKTEPLNGSGKTHPVPAVTGKTHTVAQALQVKTQETTSTSVVTTAASSKAGTAGIPASMLTVSALPSMDETVASTQQPLISALKRKHEDEDDDYDC